MVAHLVTSVMRIKKPLLMSLEIARLQPVSGQRRIVLHNSSVPLMVIFLNG